MKSKYVEVSFIVDRRSLRVCGFRTRDLKNPDYVKYNILEHLIAVKEAGLVHAIARLMVKEKLY